MSATIDARLGLLMTELKLPSIKRLALDLCAQSDREGWPGSRLLEALFEHEMNECSVRRIERHRTESALSADKRLSSFDFAAVPTVSKAQVMALATGQEWLDRGANVLRCSEFVQRLRTARRELRLAHELAKLDRFDLLILDSGRTAFSAALLSMGTLPSNSVSMPPRRSRQGPARRRCESPAELPAAGRRLRSAPGATIVMRHQAAPRGRPRSRSAWGVGKDSEMTPSSRACQRCAWAHFG